jgi:hypothetical protein
MQRIRKMRSVQLRLFLLHIACNSTEYLSAFAGRERNLPDEMPHEMPQNSRRRFRTCVRTATSPQSIA